MRARVGGTNEFAPGTLTKVVLEGRAPLVVGNVDGSIFAMQDECNHGEADLSEGEIVGCDIVCPLHGGCFDVSTGKATKRPAKRAQPTFNVHVVDGEVFVDLDANFDTSAVYGFSETT